MIQCSFDKFIIVTSFLLVFSLSIFLLHEDTTSVDYMTGLYSDSEKNATRLAEEIRILSLVMTHPGNHQKRGLRVLNTWGRRCTYIEFLSTQDDKDIPVIVSPSKEGYWNIWGKTKFGFKTAYEKYYDKVDWVKADDDTYVIVENL